MPDQQPGWVPSGTGAPGAAIVREQDSTPGATTLPIVATPAEGVPSGHAPIGYGFDETLPTPAGGQDSAIVDPNNPLFEDDAPWPSHAIRRGLRVRVPTAVLLVLLVAGGAFWGGAEVQRHRGGSSGGTASSAASRFRSLFGGAGAGGTRSGAGSFAGLGSTTSAAATGSVTFVKGDTLYVTTSSGNIVTVQVTSSTKLTRNATASASALKPGDTVVVQGSTAKDGTVTASSISATAQGVSTAGGGFGGFGGAGGAGAGAAGAGASGRAG